MILLAALAGYLVGIAVNALADSLPADRTVKSPGCHRCGAPRSVPAWSGGLAWLTRRAGCLYCGVSQPIRRPVVEAAAIGWSLALALLLPAPGHFWPSFLLSGILLLVLVIDLEHRLILHAVTAPAAVLMAMMGSLDAARGPLKTLAGGAVGFALVLGMFLLGGLFARLILRIRGRSLEEVAFGFGDVTLAGVIGLAVGFPGIIVSLTLAILAGGVFSLGYLVLMAARGRYVAFTPIPYSPFLIFGALVVFVGSRAGLFG